MTTISRSLHSDKTYDIQLKIQGESILYDFSSDIVKLEIISTITQPYQIINLTFFVDSKDMVLDKIYGQNPIDLTIKLLGEEGIEFETLQFELLFLSNGFDVPVSSILSDDKQKDRCLINLSTVIRKPFITMTTLVNEIYGATETPKTIKEIIEDLSSSIDTTLEYDIAGVNTSTPEQVCVPPTTFYNAFKYLNNTFGTHHGASIMTCSYDNIVKVINLSANIKRSQTIIISHLTQDGSNSDIIENSLDGQNYYTQDNIRVNNVTNSKFAVYGKTLKHIVKPKDSLYQVIEQDLETLIETYGVMDGQDIFIDPTLSRTKVYIEHTGNENFSAFANSMISRKIYDMSTISFSMERNIKIEPLLNCGTAVKFKTNSVDYADLTGKYILLSSKISLTKNRAGWACVSDIHLVRSNKI